MKAYESNGQDNQFSIGTHFPLYYTIGYEEKISHKWFLNVQAAWVDQPYLNIIQDVLEKNGVAKEISEVSFKAFSSAYSFQPTLKYRFKHFYIGAFYSFSVLNAKKIDYEKVADFLEVEVPEFVDMPFTSYTVAFPYIEIGLQSQLHNAGILIGKEFRFKNPKFAIGAELSFTKNITSKHVLNYSDFESLVNPVIQIQLNHDFRKFFFNDGNIPTLNLFLIYRFNRSINGLFSKKSNNDSVE